MANSSSDVVEALLAGLQVNHGLSVPEIGRQAGISRIQAYRLVRGSPAPLLRDRHAAAEIHEQKLVTKAAGPSPANPSHYLPDSPLRRRRAFLARSLATD